MRIRCLVSCLKNEQHVLFIYFWYRMKKLHDTHNFCLNWFRFLSSFIFFILDATINTLKFEAKEFAYITINDMFVLCLAKPFYILWFSFKRRFDHSLVLTTIGDNLISNLRLLLLKNNHKCILFSQRYLKHCFKNI